MSPLDFPDVLYSDDETRARAMACARGRYQRGILGGTEPLSLNRLRGKAKLYSGRYWDSQRSLFRRMTAIGIPTCTMPGEILVVGATRPPRVQVVEAALAEGHPPETAWRMGLAAAQLMGGPRK